MVVLSGQVEEGGVRFEARLRVRIEGGTVTAGDRELVVAGRRAEQEELARELGATDFTLDTPPGGFDLAIEAAGSTDAVVAALGAVRRGGTVLQLGLPPAGSTLELPGDLLVNNDLTLAASFGYTSAAWSRVVALLNKGRFRPGRIVTHTYGLDEDRREARRLHRCDVRE